MPTLFLQDLEAVPVVGLALGVTFTDGFGDELPDRALVTCLRAPPVKSSRCPGVLMTRCAYCGTFVPDGLRSKYSFCAST
jgi:hypothetical protein